MSLLDMNLGDAVEPTVVPAGEEYKLRIMSAPVDNDKNGAPYMRPIFEIPDVPTSKAFSDFLRIPHPGLSPKEMNDAKWRMTLFLQCFGMDPARPLDPEELKGREGWAILGTKDDDYGESNTVRKYIAPK